MSPSFNFHLLTSSLHLLSTSSPCTSPYSSSSFLSTSISLPPPPSLLHLSSTSSPPPLYTLLHLLTSSIDQLSSANAHPSIHDFNAWLPLHNACDNGHVECVRLITSCPSHHLGLCGLQPALDLAEGGGYGEIVAILRDAYDRFVGPSVGGSCALFFISC